MAAILASMDVSGKPDPSEDVFIDFREWASRATLEIIGQGGYGLSFNALQDPNNALRQTYRSISVPGRTRQILGVLGSLLPQWLVRRLS